MLWSMSDASRRVLSILSFLLATATPCLAESEFPGFQRNERLRVSQDAPTIEYMVLDDAPMRLLAPTWGEISNAMKEYADELDGCKLDRKSYAERLQKQLEDAPAYKKELIDFSRWLSANGIVYLEDASRKGYSMQTALTPYCVEQMLQGGAIHWDEARDFAATFSVEVGVPLRPRSFQEQFPVLFHEWGHYVFHRMMEEALGRPVPAKEAALWLNPLDEGFADFVSYAFLGAAAHVDPPMRAPLSSSLSDRQLVYDGEYPYFKTEDHSAGEPFRDVLIRISAVYGTPRAMQVAREIAAEDLAVQRKSTESAEKAANAAVSVVLKRRGIALSALLQ